MLKAILDTDILSEISKAKDKTVVQNATAYLNQYPQRMTFTDVSVYEVLYGLNVKQATLQIGDFIQGIAPHEIITPDGQVYQIAAEIRAALHRAGTPIGALDPLIAACAIRHNLPLVTGNTRHYSYVQSVGFPLLLINWREIV